MCVPLKSKEEQKPRPKNKHTKRQFSRCRKVFGTPPPSPGYPFLWRLWNLAVSRWAPLGPARPLLLLRFSIKCAKHGTIAADQHASSPSPHFYAKTLICGVWVRDRHKHNITWHSYKVMLSVSKRYYISSRLFGTPPANGRSKKKSIILQTCKNTEEIRSAKMLRFPFRKGVLSAFVQTYTHTH